MRLSTHRHYLGISLGISFVLRLRLRLGLCFSMLLLGAGQLVAQSVDPSLLNYPHNHLKWYSIRTNHFIVHF